MEKKGNISDRYPGLLPFRNDQADVFFGREREENELYHLVRNSHIVVFFSESGLGKSSLLNAGVSPLLNNDGFIAIDVRFNKTVETESETPKDPIDILKSCLSRYYHSERVLFDRSAPMLWEFIKACEFPENRVPVLIFDQFEQFFQHPVDSINAFALQLAEVVHPDTPTRITRWLLGIEPDERTATQMKWIKQPPLKIVFVIRSDRLADIQKLDAVMPSVLNTRLELKAMRDFQAREAIVKPAKIEDPRFSVRPFEYHKDVIDDLIIALSDKNTGEIGCSQLQIVCRYIEKKIMNGEAVLQNNTVDMDFFNPALEVKGVLQNYYEEQLKLVGGAEEQAVCRSVLEDYLLSGEWRASLLENQIIQLLKGDRDLLHKLLESRLIKVENTHLGTTYEISHDSLVSPILKSRKEQLEVKRQIDEELNAIREADTLITKYRNFNSTGTLEQATGDLTRAIHIYDHYVSHKNRIESRLVKGKVFLGYECFDDAVDIFMEARAIAEEKEPNLLGAVLEHLASLHLSTSKEVKNKFAANEYIEYYVRALKIYEENSDFTSAARVAELLGGINEKFFDYLLEDELLQNSISHYSIALKHYQNLNDIPGEWRSELGKIRMTNRSPGTVWGYLTDLLTGERYALKGQKKLTIGRNSQQITNDVGFSSKYNTVSRRHLTITPDEYLVEDLKSKNGTTINSFPLFSGNPLALADNDILVLANVIPLLFTIVEIPKPRRPDDCWGLFTCNDRSFSYLHNFETEYAYDLSRFQLSTDTSSFDLVRFRTVNGIPQQFLNEIKVDIGTWKVAVYYPDMDGRSLSRGFLEPNKWDDVIGFPLQPVLMLDNSSPDDEPVEHGLLFQLIPFTDLYPTKPD